LLPFEAFEVHIGSTTNDPSVKVRLASTTNAPETEVLTLDAFNGGM
jgi:hypothetical protein